MMTKPLIRFLIPHGHPPKQKKSLANLEESSPKSITVPFLGGRQDSEEVDNDTDANDHQGLSSIRDLLKTPTHTVHRLWRKFDDAIMRPVFGGRGFVPVAPTSPTESESNGQQEWD